MSYTTTVTSTSVGQQGAAAAASAVSAVRVITPRRHLKPSVVVRSCGVQVCKQRGQRRCQSCSDCETVYCEAHATDPWCRGHVCSNAHASADTYSPCEHPGCAEQLVDVLDHSCRHPPHAAAKARLCAAHRRLPPAQHATCLKRLADQAGAVSEADVRVAGASPGARKRRRSDSSDSDTSTASESDFAGGGGGGAGAGAGRGSLSGGASGGSASGGAQRAKRGRSDGAAGGAGGATTTSTATTTLTWGQRVLNGARSLAKSLFGR